MTSGEPPATGAPLRLGEGPAGGALRLRSGRPSSLNLAMLIILVNAGVIGLFQIAVGLEDSVNFAGVVLFTGVFWIWIVAGLVAWWRRPGNATGSLIVIGGLAVFIAGAQNLDIPVLVMVSVAFATSIFAVTIHLLLAFPLGRLRGRLPVAIVVISYVNAVGLQVALYVFRTAGPLDLFDPTLTVQRIVGLAAVGSTAVLLARRLRQADAAHRRILLPLYIYGIVAVLVFGSARLVLPLFGLDGVSVGVIQVLFLAGVPLAFLAGVLGGRFARTGELDALSTWLGATGADRQSAEAALASTLGDRSLQVVYWAAERSRYVDASGADFELPGPGEGRTALEVRVDSRLIGAIVYDNGLIGDPDAVRRVGQVLAIVIDRERLLAELVASRDALLGSRLRLVQAADSERTRIAQDLHDGLQVQLVLLALEAQQIANAPDAAPGTRTNSTELRRRIDDAAADLRRLVHNVLPAALVERGLSAATEDLVDRLELPVTLDLDVDDDSLAPAITYTAFVVVAEGLTNAIKYSQATLLWVRVYESSDTVSIEIGDNGVGGASVEAGTGLKSLIDRVDVLGGSFRLESAPDRGTIMKVELPCAL
ncbi:sensor histidine kinase [Subtercola boreus]|nr:histidine kinase [Subtercola boreus]